VFVFGILILLLISANNWENSPKINGVSFVASRDSISEKHIQPVLNINANYAAIMPFGFIRNKDNPEIIYNTGRQWFGESRPGAKQYIEELHKHRVKVMMKPHIWMRGEFTGHMKMDSEDLWKQLEQSYSEFILDFAELAQETNVDIWTRRYFKRSRRGAETIN